MSQGEILSAQLIDWRAESLPQTEPSSSLAQDSALSIGGFEAFCHQLFEAQVKTSPDATAVIFDDQKLTYQELNQRSNQLAHYLRAIGVGLETFVGLYIERSLDMVVGLLGILKAGGAYVPLDPSHPADRVAFILQDTQASVILTQASLANSLPSHSAQVICLDTSWSSIAQESSENPSSVGSADSLIYTIYTSGSTGQPKGVMISHGSICNQLRWRQSTFPLTAADRVLQNISLSFDPSVWQIFWPLCSGAQLVLPRPGGQQDVAYLVRLIAQQEVTVIALVPSVLRVFLETKGLDQCQALKHVFCGGEALTLDLQERFVERFGAEVLLHNVYGPTEAAIDATWWTCDMQRTAHSNHRPASSLVAPIGRPISNAQVYVLDEQLRLQPAGEAGELHIGGAGLARGYLNRPELTAEKFIANPFSEEPSDRLYKTGDLVRALPDGNLEFLGRIDHQVKIRGFRIELEEIEAALNQHPDVQQSVVVAHEIAPGDKRLLAYWVPSRQGVASTAALRAWLKAKLPEYMVPTMFIELAEFPLNPNGKIDRRALPSPDRVQSPTKSASVAPRTVTEQSLAALWEKILNVRPVGATDNFFELGGNSLLAAYLFTEIEQVWGQALPISMLFEAPTLEQLATVLQNHTAPQEMRSLVPIQKGQGKPPLFCMHTRTGQVFEYYPLAQQLAPEQPVYGLQAPQVGGKAVFHASIEQMATAYLEEIRARQPQGPYFLCGYSFGGLIAYEVAQQLMEQGQTIELLALIDTYNTSQRWFQPLSRAGKVRQHLRNLQQLGWHNTLSYFQGRAAFKPIPDDNIQSLFLQANDRCEQLAAAYKPQPYSGRVLLFKASQQPTRDFMRSTITDPSLGWRALVPAGLEIQELPCDHFSLLKEPALNTLAAQLQAALGAAGAQRRFGSVTLRRAA